MGRVGWVGWGWWRFFHLHTCDMLWTWRFLHLHTCDMLRKSWGGLGGWGGDDDVSFTSTNATCYGLDVSCTCTHETCYVWGWWRFFFTCTHVTRYGLDVSCTCTHVTCYASLCTATCGASTTETGGSRSDNCANHTDKRKTRVRMKFFFFFFRCFLLPNLKSQKLSSAPSFGGFFTRQ